VPRSIPMTLLIVEMLLSAANPGPKHRRTSYGGEYGGDVWTAG
jgi:hypothetical protein